MDKTKALKVGDHIIFVDEKRVAHDALVETWWLGATYVDGKAIANDSIEKFEREFGEGKRPAVNLVFISDDPDHRDQYGGQKVHKGSVIHGDVQTPPRLGNYWLFASEL